MRRRSNAAPGDTKLAQFMRANGVTSLFIVGAAHVSQRYLAELRAGTSDPTRAMMVKIARAVSYRLQRPVEVGELFDLDLAPPR
jgi:predicted transcriptional regulator